MGLKVQVIRPKQTFSEWCASNGLDVVVEERAPGYPSWVKRYHCAIKGAEMAAAGLLVGVHGNGNTPMEALADYVDFQLTAGAELRGLAATGACWRLKIPEFAGLGDIEFVEDEACV